MNVFDKFAVTAPNFRLALAYEYKEDVRRDDCLTWLVGLIYHEDGDVTCVFGYEKIDAHNDYRDFFPRR